MVDAESKGGHGAEPGAGVDGDGDGLFGGRAVPATARAAPPRSAAVAATSRRRDFMAGPLQLKTTPPLSSVVCMRSSVEPFSNRLTVFAATPRRSTNLFFSSGRSGLRSH